MVQTKRLTVREEESEKDEGRRRQTEDRKRERLKEQSFLHH